MKKFLMILLTVALLVNLVGCGGNGLSDSKLLELLEENGYNYNSVKIETVLDLSNNVSGLDSDDNNKLLLVNYDSYYGYVVINTKTNKLDIPTFGYIPLNVVQQEIWNMGKDVNVENADILKKYIEQYGFKGLENKKNAENYLREITGNSEIIPTEKAQNIISNSTMEIFPSIKSNDEVDVIFEPHSAVPLYYAEQSSQMVYNWNGLLPESTYEVWAANVDRSTQQTMIALYGKPYTMKTVWNVVDSDMKEAGTYNSLEDIKKNLS